MSQRGIGICHPGNDVVLEWFRFLREGILSGYLALLIGHMRKLQTPVTSPAAQSAAHRYANKHLQ